MDGLFSFSLPLAHWVRGRQRTGNFTSVVLAAGLGLLMLTQTGCAGFLGHLGYWSGGSLVEPEYEGLTGHRVAVICVSDVTSYGAGTEDKMLARKVSSLLSENVPEIEVVPTNEVANWIDNNDWNSIDYREAGKGLRADRVVAIDLSGFRLHEDQTLYKGRAELAVTVFDMKNGGTEVFRRTLPEVSHPETGYYHTSDTSESTFRKVFLSVLARRASRFFFEYDAMYEFGPAPANVKG